MLTMLVCRSSYNCGNSSSLKKYSLNAGAEAPVGMPRVGSPRSTGNTYLKPCNRNSLTADLTTRYWDRSLCNSPAFSALLIAAFTSDALILSSVAIWPCVQCSSPFARILPITTMSCGLIMISFDIRDSRIANTISPRQPVNPHTSKMRYRPTGTFLLRMPR